MNSVFIIIFMTFCLHFIAADEFVYTASAGQLQVMKIDTDSGKLSEVQTLKIGVTIFTFSQNKKFLYTQTKDAIATYKVEANGKLSFVHKAAIRNSGVDLKTDRTDGFLVSPSYRKGVVSVWKLEDGVYRGELVQELKLTGGVHSGRFSKNNKFLVVPCTKKNTLFELTFDSNTGQVAKKSQASGPKEGAKQPRHLVFHPKMKIAYTTMERERPGVAIWKWDSDKGNFELLQSIDCFVENVGYQTTADLHVSPDHKFLFASRRGTNHILLYKINSEDGTLSFIEKFPCENGPRAFCVSKSGDFIYVAGQNEAAIGAYKVNRETGHLTKVEQYKTGKKPLWIETLIP